jgi:hypothetical protein
VRGMPSSSRLSRPAEWPGSGGEKPIAGLLFVGVLGIACVPVGLGFVAIGKPGGLKYALLLAALFLLVAVYGYITRVRPTHRDANVALGRYDDLPAIELKYSGAAFAILVGIVTCLAVTCSFASAEFFLAGDEIPASPVAATLCGAAALFFVSFLVFVATGQLQRGRVVLSPRGIYQRGRAFSSFLAWEAIAGVKASYDGLTPYVLVVAYTNTPWEKRQYGKPWRLDKLPPVPMIAIDCTALAIDRNLVYHFVKYYVDNPHAREELGAEASLQRARTADLP